MSSLFSFDEEKLAKDFNDTIIEDELDPNELDAKPFDGNILHVHTETRFPRRKSSVYRRLSIKSTASVTSQDFIIPANYEYSDDGNPELNVSNSRKVLSDFTPIKVLGKGAYGKVHLVQDRHNNKLFAQKQLRKPTINIHEEQGDIHTKHVERTISERKILTNITHHPNIVKLFYALQDSDKFYLILEYIPGGELFHHLTSNNSLGNVFKEEDVAFYAAQMALGLKHLHELGIVYRDLKPENCLLNNAGHLVLTDFGLSKSIGEDSESCKSIIGTPEYMAPEILKGDEYDYLVDWWSLGCVIYDMMTGKPPFTGNSHKVIQDKIIKNKLKMPFYFSMDAKDLLNKLLNKNPAKRFPVDEKWSIFESHRFFRKLNWKSLKAQDDSCNPPIIPVITDPILAENFSEEFTSMAISDFGEDQGINIPHDLNYNINDSFKGFSYTASNSFIDRFC